MFGLSIHTVLLTTSARNYVRYTLLASFAYRENADKAAAFFDKEALEHLAINLGTIDEKWARDLYHKTYTLWRDSGFDMGILVSILDTLVNAR